MAHDLQAQVAAAVAHFWKTRKQQEGRQGEQTGRRDAGSRTAVTGGKQLDGFVDWVYRILQDAGMREDEVHIDRRRTVLPGYFRATKEWDLVVTVDGKLLATIEFKSQVGPSFGNNFNNRTEEAIGSAHDLQVAYREGIFRDSAKPWLGYLMLLEDCPRSNAPVSVVEPHFPVSPEFRDASYVQRYQLLCRRLVREQLYDAACFITSQRETGQAGQFSVPDDEIGIVNFASGLAARAASFSMYRPE